MSAAERTLGLPVSADGAGVFLVANPSSGTAVMRADPLAAFTERMSRAEVHVLDDGEDPGAVVRDALARADPPVVVGVCGGDGSVAAVAHVARTAGVPLVVVPGGTFNHFARTAGVFTALDAVGALTRGEGIRADVAELQFGDLEPVTVVNAASVGIYPDVIEERDRLRSRLGKWLATLVAARRVIATAAPVSISIGTRRASVWAMVVGVDRNDRGIPAPLQRRQLQGGVLDVRLLHAGHGSRRHAIAALAFGRRTAAVLRALKLLPDRVEAFTTTSLEVIVRPRAGQTMAFVHDGEHAAEAPAEASAQLTAPGYRTTIRVIPEALTVYRPHRSRA